MSQHDDHLGAEDEDVVRRLREGKPRIGAFELDRIKTTVMSRGRPANARRTAPRSRLLVAFLTVGLMVAGTAGTIAASNSSVSGGSGAAQSQYRPPKCNPRHEECKCPSTSVRASRDRCVCPAGETFAEGTNDCRCPDGSNPTDSGKCVTCPDGGTFTDAGRCVCPDHGTEVDGKCQHQAPAPTTAPDTTTSAPKSSTPTGAAQPVSTPGTPVGSTELKSKSTTKTTGTRANAKFKVKHTKRSKRSKRSRAKTKKSVR
jgi:hypothetical protein